MSDPWRAGARGSRLLRRTVLVAGAAAAGLAAAGSWSAWRHLAPTASRRVVATRVDAIPPAAPGTALEFLVIGDSGQDTEVRERVVQAMSAASARLDLRFVVTTGDNVYPHGVDSVDDPGWKVHFEDAFDAPGLDVPFYPSLGNHDHQGVPGAQVEYSAREPRWVLPAAYHSFVQELSGGGSVELFVLDTTPLRDMPLLRLETDPQLAWLEDALARSTATWKIAVGHHPMRSGGQQEGSSKVRWHLTRLFARHDVDLYLSGHNHDLELLDGGHGWLQVISGAASRPRPVASTPETLFFAQGGGFAWLSFRGETAWLQFVDAGGEALASFRLERGPV